MKDEHGQKKNKGVYVGMGKHPFGREKRRRITSKSAIKMCIKMSKNIYLHKVNQSE